MEAGNDASAFLFQFSPVPSWIWDIEAACFVDVNDAALALYGYGREQFLRLTSLDLLSPQELPRLQAAMSALAGADPGLHHAGFWRHRRCDHSEISVDIHWAPMRFRERPAVLVSAYDVTHYIRASQQLRETQQRWARFWDESPDAMLVNNFGHIAFVNKAAVRMFGATSAEDLLGRDPLTIVHPDSVAGVQERIARLRAGESVPSEEYRMLRLDGSSVEVESTASTFEDLGQPAIQVVLRDITERKKAQRAIRESEERYRGFVETCPDAIWIKKGRRIVFVNDALVRLLGAASRDDVIGRSPLELVDPEFHTFVTTSIAQTLATGGHLRCTELRLVRFDGTPVDVEISASPCMDGGERAIQVIAHDVTERKRSERELRRLAAALLTAQEEERRRVARELHDDLTQRLALLGIEIDFAQSESPHEVREKLAALHRQVAELSDCVRSISHQLHPSALSHAGLDAALRNQVAEFERTSGVQAQFAAESPASAPMEVATVVFRVAQEALRNVARHAGATHVSVILRGDQNALKLTVIDDGRGFTEDAPRGLGLVSMQERVRLVNGTLQVDSEPGHGTRICVFVPLSS